MFEPLRSEGFPRGAGDWMFERWMRCRVEFAPERLGKHTTIKKLGGTKNV